MKRMYVPSKKNFLQQKLSRVSIRLNFSVAMVWLQQSTADPRLVLKGIAVLLSFTMGPLPCHEMKKLIWPSSSS